MTLIHFWPQDLVTEKASGLPGVVIGIKVRDTITYQVEFYAVGKVVPALRFTAECLEKR